jgi:hypothetical protein
LNLNALLPPCAASLKGGGGGGDVWLAQGHPNDIHGELQSDFLIFTDFHICFPFEKWPSSLC